MKIEADLHIHTTASGHAYSTLAEVVEAAVAKGLKLIAITDHGPMMPGGPHEYYFGNLKVLPEYIKGLRVLKGIEANILLDGGLDLAEPLLKNLDFVAAGIHDDVGYDDYKKADLTEAMVKAINNPLVQMVTHPDNVALPVDLREVVKAAAENNVILELNASSFDKDRLGRRGNPERISEMCRLAMEYKAPLCLNSDAHYVDDVGNIKNLLPILKNIGLKEEDVLNLSVGKTEEFIRNGRAKYAKSSNF